MVDFIKAKRYKDQRVICIQHKLDGHRVLLSKGHAITRVGTDIWEKLLAVDHLAAVLHEIPSGCIVDAELHAPGTFATSVKTMINKGDPKLLVSAFAMPLVRGQRTSYLGIPGVLDILRHMGFHTPYTEYFESRVITPYQQEVLKRRAKKAGIEGWIAKSSHLDGWYKIKVTGTVDAIVTDWTISTSDTYYGQLRGLQCSLHNGNGKLTVICNTGNGLTKEFKERMEGKEKELVGQVVELEYDEVASQGKLKFPRILRFRDDKKQSECTMDQLS